MPPGSPTTTKAIMASSSSSARHASSSKHGGRASDHKPKNREATPTAPRLEAAKMSDGDAQLAAVLKTDLDSMRSLITCSICDQLLYEPWTLACGHTYCYSCLCSWFVPNKRKKTCPECRAAVKQVPAPAFLVKQMVEIFVNRSELMISDESVQQHQKQRAEELEIVEKDKNSPQGLFKGTFPEHHGDLWHDEEDGVLRCPSCGHEYEGGPICDTCGETIDDPDIYDFSDEDDGNLSDLDMDEVELEFDAGYGMQHHHHHHYYDYDAHFARPPAQLLNHYHHRHLDLDAETEGDDEDHSNSEMSDGQDSDDDDAGSLDDFIIPDEDEDAQPSERRQRRRRVITISDDDDEDDDDGSDDEGGAITSRRRQRPDWGVGRGQSETPSVAITITDDENGSSANGSEFGDDDSHEARMVLRASGGWSPLDEGDDDAEGLVQYGYTATEDERATDESDTETIGNMGSDGEDDDRSRNSLSQTPRYQTPDYHREVYPSSMGDATPNSYASENEYEYDDQSAHMDGDGDTEMSASPNASRSSRSVSVESSSYNRGESLGVSNEIAEGDGDSSDSSIRPPPRRQPRLNPSVQQYDPRISMLFAEHQLTMRDTQNPAGGLDGWESDARRVEPASRTRRRPLVNYNLASPRGNDHHLMPPRGVEPGRSSRGIPSGRVIPSPHRPGRPQRQYQR